MLQYIRRLQGTNKTKGSSLVVTIPQPLIQVLELAKGDNIILELARDQKGKVIVLRKLQKEIQTQEKQLHVNVIT
jgi:antitoxin component of MazEF toxin-antitoxin module